MAAPPGHEIVRTRVVCQSDGPFGGTWSESEIRPIAKEPPQEAKAEQYVMVPVMEEPLFNVFVITNDQEVCVTHDDREKRPVARLLPGKEVAIAVKPLQPGRKLHVKIVFHGAIDKFEEFDNVFDDGMEGICVARDYLRVCRVPIPIPREDGIEQERIYWANILVCADMPKHKCPQEWLTGKPEPPLLSWGTGGKPAPKPPRCPLWVQPGTTIGVNWAEARKQTVAFEARA